MPPVISYEFSIYDAYPPIFWVFLLSAFFLGQLLVIIQIFQETDQKSWIFGLLAILTINAILFFLPMIRGYLIYGSGDVLTHIGWVKDIIQTGHFGNSNFYPINHIIATIIHNLSTLSVTTISLLIPPFFSLFFLFTLYLFGKTFFYEKKVTLLFLLFSYVPWLGYYYTAFVPYVQSFMLLPLVLLILFKKCKNEIKKTYNFLLLTMCILIIFYHPLTIIAIILIFLLMTYSFDLKKFLFIPSYQNPKLFGLTLIILIIFSIWSSYLLLIVRIIRPFFLEIFGLEDIRTEFDKNYNLVSSVDIDYFYLIRLIFQVYGQYIILTCISLICVFYLIWLYRTNKIQMKFSYFFSAITFSFFFICSVALLFFNGSFGFLRVFSYAMFFSIILISLIIPIIGLFSNFLTTDFVKIKIIVLFLVLVTLTVFSFFNLFYSPITKNPNLQVSRGDFIGASTFFHYRDESLNILELGLSQDRFYDAIYGKESSRNNVFYSNDLAPPDHLYFSNSNAIQGHSTRSKYLLINTLGRNFYPEIYPEFKYRWRYSYSDFKRLNDESKSNFIYNNGDLSIFIV